MLRDRARKNWLLWSNFASDLVPGPLTYENREHRCHLYTGEYATTQLRTICGQCGEEYLLSLYFEGDKFETSLATN